MNWKLVLTLVGLGSVLLLSGSAQPQHVQAAPLVFASPVHAGCYLEKPDRCKIHVDPFTINLASGRRLVFFQLLTAQAGTGTQKVIYDFRPDQSNPVPLAGSSFTPSRVARDFAATCGQSYVVSLQGQDTGDAGAFNLGVTAQFTCPIGTYRVRLPGVRK
jgi:hypothetical protein